MLSTPAVRVCTTRNDGMPLITATVASEPMYGGTKNSISSMRGGTPVPS